MTFNEAFKIATRENAEVQRAAEIVGHAIITNTASPCYTFSIGAEAFSFGFDGVDVHKVKHTAKRSATLINRGDALVVRE